MPCYYDHESRQVHADYAATIEIARTACHAHGLLVDGEHEGWVGALARHFGLERQRAERAEAERDEAVAEMNRARADAECEAHDADSLSVEADELRQRAERAEATLRACEAMLNPTLPPRQIWDIAVTLPVHVAKAEAALAAYDRMVCSTCAYRFKPEPELRMGTNPGMCRLLDLSCVMVGNGCRAWAPREGA